MLEGKMTIDPDLGDWITIKKQTNFESKDNEKEMFVLWVHDIMHMHGHMLTPGFEIEAIEEMVGMTPEAPEFEDHLDIANAIWRLESKGALAPVKRTLH